MVVIHSPYSFQPERSYIYDVVFHEFLNWDYKIYWEERKDISLSFANNAQLSISDLFFSMNQAIWMKLESLPTEPLKRWDVTDLNLEINVCDNLIPVLFGENVLNNQYLVLSNNQAILKIDLFGSIFFMLSRYEEIVSSDRDRPGQFYAKQALAFRENFLERPIVNEYLNIFLLICKKLYSGLEIKKRTFTCWATHDVDTAFKYYKKNLINVLRIFKKYIFKCQFYGGFNFIWGWLKYKNNLSKDPYFCFDQIMRIDERFNVKGTFFFIVNGQSVKDGDYSIFSEDLKKLFLHIYSHGHKIGLHTSFNTFEFPEFIKKEFQELLKLCSSLGIQQTQWEARHHYLRWNIHSSFRALQDAGLSYDSSLGFPDSIGFRCGTCYAFSVYDFKVRQKLNLIERPLIVMDSTLFSSQYMNMSDKVDLAYNKTIKLKNICRNFGGEFVILWHNNTFENNMLIEFYKGVLEA